MLVSVNWWNQTNYAQEKKNYPNKNSIYSTAKMNVKPEFSGGQKEFYEYVKKTISFLQKQKTYGEKYM